MELSESFCIHKKESQKIKESKKERKQEKRKRKIPAARVISLLKILSGSFAVKRVVIDSPDPTPLTFTRVIPITAPLVSSHRPRYSMSISNLSFSFFFLWSFA